MSTQTTTQTTVEEAQLVRIVSLLKRAVILERKASEIRASINEQIKAERKELRAIRAEIREALSSLSDSNKVVDAARKYLAASTKEEQLKKVIADKVREKAFSASSLQRRANALTRAAKIWSLALPIGEADDQSVEQALAFLASLRK